MKNILMTGATGFLGSHFLYGVLRRGGRAVALVRGSDPADARARLIGVLSGVAASLELPPLGDAALRSLSIVLGDITLPHCGLRAEALERLRGNVETLTHFAASLAHRDDERGAVASHNIEGTAHVLSCAQALDVQRLVYVSTAYTAGRGDGVVAEALHPETTAFSNDYERTKAAAERMIATHCAHSGVDYRIVRPSIVIGPSSTFKPGGSTTGVYGFVRELYRQRVLLNRGDKTHRFNAAPDSPLNLIPVDHVVGPMLQLDDPGFPPGHVLHLTNPCGPALGECMKTTCELLDIRPIELVPGHVPSTAIERRLARTLDFYGPYLRTAKQFMRSIPCEFELSTGEALRPYLIQACIEQQLKEIEARRVSGLPDDAPANTTSDLSV